jgi:tetratricopeptide (TPR) repeat protein
VRAQPSTDASSPRAGAIALAVGSAIYVALVLAASIHPGARGWGLHAAGFLPLPARVPLLAALIAGAALIARGAASRESTRRSPASEAGRGFPLALLALLSPYVVVLWALRARTQLLGDGTVWLATVRTGEHRAYSEPLFAALWHGFAALVRLAGGTPDGTSMALYSMLCGLAAVPVLVGIAREIRVGNGWLLPFALLLTLGTSALYFGYIESYSTSAVFVLLYLWLALRRARGADPPWLLALALPLAIAAHLSALSLVPSYLLLLALEKRPLAQRLLLLVLPFALLAGLLLALDYRPASWAAPLHAATSGMREGFEGATFRRPYGFLSYGHLADVANAVLLAMPVPALLLAAWLTTRRGGRILLVLATAAVPGALLLVGLMTPVSPAQDWDLASLFLLPAAVLGVAAGARLWGGRPPRWMAAGLVTLSLVPLLSFVLVNASESASVRRFAALVSDPSRVSRYGRSYGASVLELHYRDRGRYAEALPYARAALEAEPTNPRNWTNVGYELMQLGRPADAIPYLQQGIARGPGRWEGRYNLGLCYMELGRYAEAVPAFAEAVRLGPDQPVFRHNLGLALYRSGHPDSAVVVWREILARWPGYASSLHLPGTGTPQP